MTYGKTAHSKSTSIIPSIILRSAQLSKTWRCETRIAGAPEAEKDGEENEEGFRGVHLEPESEGEDATRGYSNDEGIKSTDAIGYEAWDETTEECNIWRWRLSAKR